MAILNAKVVSELLDREKNKKIRSILADAAVADVAILINQLPNRHKVPLYLLLPGRKASDVLLEISAHSRKFILKSLKDKYIVSAIEKAESDETADILEEVSESRMQRILSKLTPKQKQAVAPLIKYEEDTAGGIMQTELLALRGRTKVADAITAIRKSMDSQGASYIYVIDKDYKLKGVISIKELFIASKSATLNQVMNKDIIKLTPNLDKEEVANIFRQQDLLALPVVDAKRKLLGRVTIDDVLDVMEEEVSEDMFRISGVNPEENIFDPIGSSIKKRLPWLVINLVTAIIAAFTIALFEDTIAAVVILAALMPIIAGMGGNAGTQTLALMVRGFALNEINLTNYGKVVWKEVTLGAINGTIIGIVMGIVGYVWTQNMWISAVILIAMIADLVVAGLAGTTIPILLKKFKFDPAVSSTVFVTTFTDVIGFFVFLGTASLLLPLIV